ncbi:MAG: tetratricopeptide repeat protein [Proteobacteria bacterium]|nr:tetratricopeptide repeat protein [Pseudomonadota bacterium]
MMGRFGIALRCVVVCAVLAIPTAMAASPAPLPPSREARQDGERLSALLRGEFLLQSGATGRAAADYLQAAQASTDPALAQRAAGIALLAHDDAMAARALGRWRQLAPQSVDLAQLEALLALREGDRAAASARLRALLGTTDGWKRVVQTLALATDSPVADAVAGDIYASGRWPTGIEALLALGDGVRRLGDIALASRIVDAAITRYPREPRVWLLAADVFKEAGNVPFARKAIDSALAEAHGDPKIRALAADAYARLGDPRLAAETLAHGAQDDTTYGGRAAWLASADDRAGLAALYAEVKAHTQTPGSDRGLLLGQLAEYLKRPDEALAWYRGVADGAAHDEAQNRIAIVLEGRGDLSGALAVLRAQHGTAVASVDAQADSYRIEAELLAKHGQKKAALAAYDRGLAFFDGEPNLLYGRALLLEDMDRITEAEADLRAIIAADPNNAAALNALGYTLADRTNRYAEAQELIESALRLQPDSPAFLDSLGWVQHRLGRDEPALRNLRRAFSLLKDPEIAAHLGEVLWLRGDKNDARAVWKQGLALDKDNRAMQRVVNTYHP